MCSYSLIIQQVFSVFKVRKQYQIHERVFHQVSNTSMLVKKISAASPFLTHVSVFEHHDETHFLVFDILLKLSKLERFSFECRKIKTKVITLTNHNSHKQSNQPIRARSKYMSPVPSAGKRARVSHDWFWFYF